jgi:hypothetical protein
MATPTASGRWRGPRRVAPADSPADAIERIAPKRHHLETGDVVITRERLPQINPQPLSPDPQWRYRVQVHPEIYGKRVFNAFTHAASEGERLAGERHARLMFVEDDVPVLIADYRRA